MLEPKKEKESEKKKGTTKNSRNLQEVQVPKSQTSTKEGTPTKQQSIPDNDIEINNSSSSSMSHITQLLSKKKLNYSQIYNKVPYHSAQDNFVFNMISSRNNNARIDKVSDLINNMKNSFEMMNYKERKNSITASTGLNGNNNSNNKYNTTANSVKLSCCFFSKK